MEQVDWNKLWREAQLEASFSKRRQDSAKFWSQWAHYYNTMKQTDFNRAERIISQFGVNKETTILDIGSGPGTLAIPLAKIAKQVTAIEPSEGMLDELKKNAQKEHLTNIFRIPKKWEDVALGSELQIHDIVVASYSLDMPDIRAALEKMHSAAKKAVCIYWFAGKQAVGNEDIWPRLFGEPYVPGPDHIYLVNILYQLGIYPNIEIISHDAIRYYIDMEDAIRSSQIYYEISTPEATEVIKNHLEQILVPEDGILCSLIKLKTAMLWWHKKN